MNKRIQGPYTESGITLIEMLVVVLIIGVLAAIAAPSFRDFFQQQRVKGATEGLAAALQNTRAEAIKTNDLKRLVFTPAGVNTVHESWCFGVTSNLTCDCGVAGSCEEGAVVASADYNDVSVRFTSREIGFDPVRGASVEPATVTFTFSTGSNVALGVAAWRPGSVRVCRPANTRIRGYNDSGDCP